MIRMMKIGVISDTHVPTAARALPSCAVAAFAGVDMILHAGDIVDMSVLDELEVVAPVKAVRGNMDSGESANLPDKRIIEIGNIKIGLIHGWGAPGDLPLRARTQFDESVSCVVFGHSHQPFNSSVAGALMFNPGSPTDRRFAPFFSVGILTLNGKRITGEIIRL